MLEQFLNANFTKYALNKILDLGLKGYVEEFPMIISSIKSKSQESEIFVLTLYSALKRSDIYFEVFDPYICPKKRVSLCISQRYSFLIFY